MLDIKTALATFEDLENEDLYDLILGLAEDRPELFVGIADALESVLMRDILQEMREETIDGTPNGYPLYPELQYDD